MNARRIMQYGRKSENFIYNLLCTQYNKKNIIKNAIYRIGANGTTEVDLIIVLKSGVHVIEIKGIKGYIDNPYKGDWCQHYRERVFMFQNPFDQNVTHLRAIQQIFKQEEISNVPISNLVVFSDPAVKFKHKEETLLKSPELLTYLSNANRNKFLKPKEITYIVKVLRSHQLKGRRIKRDHINNINNKYQR